MTQKKWAYFLSMMLPMVASAQAFDIGANERGTIGIEEYSFNPDTISLIEINEDDIALQRKSIHTRFVENPYAQPYQFATSIKHPDSKRMWVNTGLLTGAFVGTLFVLECLPEDATSWNRATLQEIPLFKRWYQHVLKQGPEWDHDNPIFNYVLHPYAGAAYFMAARSCGYNFYKSLLYSACISTIGWEFGIEAFMERPSYQDLFITPIVGSIMGEGFYRIKRHIANNGYELAGSRFLGGFVAFLVDPVNEFIGLFMGNPAREYASYVRQAKQRVQGSLQPWVAAGYSGFTLSLTF